MRARLSALGHGRLFSNKILSNMLLLPNFTKSQFEDEIGDSSPLTLLFSKWQTVQRLFKRSNK
jgi:hypothetical protein